MKHAPFLVLWTLAVAFIGLAPVRTQALTVSLDDVIFLTQNDVSDETILAFLAHRRVTLPLDATDVLRLREAGVSEEIIRYLLENPYALNSVRTAYARPIDYYAIYPSYYYGTRLVSVTAFPRYWHDHHYFGFAHAAHHRGLNHRPGHSLGHRVAVTVGNRHHRNHDLGLGGGHVGRHRADHHIGPDGAHHVGRNSRHVGRHGSTHGRGHSGGHHGSHGGGH